MTCSYLASLLKQLLPYCPDISRELVIIQTCLLRLIVWSCIIKLPVFSLQIPHFTKTLRLKLKRHMKSKQSAFGPREDVFFFYPQPQNWMMKNVSLNNWQRDWSTINRSNQTSKSKCLLQGKAQMAPTSVNAALFNCGLTYRFKRNNFPSNSLWNTLLVSSLDC